NGTATWRVSPLAQGRGLKQRLCSASLTVLCVAPRAGARIETPHRGVGRPQAASPLAQGRGLKPFPRRLCPALRAVAPRAGARIETEGGERRADSKAVAPRAGARIETTPLDNL